MTTSFVTSGVMSLMTLMAFHTMADWTRDLSKPRYTTPVAEIYQGDRPLFKRTPKNVTVGPGDRAVLKCRVENLGTKTVVWKRAEEANPVSIGMFLFSADLRYSVEFEQRINEWSLIIRDVRHQDAGIYQCQVRTKRDSYNYDVQLNVKEIQVTGSEYVERGSTIMLNCSATGIREPPRDLEWFKGEKQILSDATNGVTITKKIESSNVHVSTLVIRQSMTTDSGDYTCRSSDQDSDTVRVYVVNVSAPERRVADWTSDLSKTRYTTPVAEIDQGDRPLFKHTPKNITVGPGDRAVLKCRVENLGTKTVTWKRADDVHPLTIGLFPFAPDTRISVDHNQRTNEWSLVIQDVRPLDEGTYQCQISTKNEHDTYDIRLNVKNIQVTGTEYVERGSTIELICNATGKPEPPHDVEWFKEDRKINSDAANGVIITKKIETKVLVSILVIRQSTMTDSGEYTCRSSNQESETIKVHVVNVSAVEKRGTNVEKAVGFSVSRAAAPSSQLLLLLTRSHVTSSALLITVVMATAIVTR